MMMTTIIYIFSDALYSSITWSGRALSQGYFKYDWYWLPVDLKQHSYNVRGGGIRPTTGYKEIQETGLILKYIHNVTAKYHPMYGGHLSSLAWVVAIDRFNCARIRMHVFYTHISKHACMHTYIHTYIHPCKYTYMSRIKSCLTSNVVLTVNKYVECVAK